DELAVQERLVADYAGVPEYRRLLVQIQINLTTAKAVAAKKNLTNLRWSLFGRPPAKRILDLRQAEQLAVSNQATGDDLYNAACAFALAAAQAQAPTAEQHAARAVTALRQAFGRGFQDIPRMLNDVDFTSMRTRTDYVDLLWTIADAPAAK